jgi:alkylhydroperoxidase family enzyme
MSVDLDSDATGTTAVIAEVLAELPDVAAALDAVHRSAWEAVDSRLLDLCRIRAAHLIGCDSEATAVTPGSGVEPAVAALVAQWPTSTVFDARDRAVLAWCEQFVIDVASLSDDVVADVRGHLGADGLVDFTNAFLVVEQRQRLRVLWEHLDLMGETDR